MRTMSRTSSRRHALTLAVVVTSAFTATALVAARTQSSTPPSATTKAAMLEDFEARLEGYLDLRSKLAGKLKPLSSTASAAELTARQDALASAIRQARKTAKPGDLIPPAMAAHLKALVTADFKNRGAEARKAAVQEVKDGVVLTINRPYPADAALPTVPPLLLAKLPVLPDNLQYRFVDRHLALVDGDAQLILDYVPAVLPPH